MIDESVYWRLAGGAAALALGAILHAYMRSHWNRLCQNTFTIDFDIQPLAC